MNILTKFLELFDWYIHVLHNPRWIFTSINTNIRPPLLSITNFNENEWIHLIQKTTSIHIKMSVYYMQSQKSNCWDNETTLHLWLNDDLRLHHLWLLVHLLLNNRLLLNYNCCSTRLYPASRFYISFLMETYSYMEMTSIHSSENKWYVEFSWTFCCE